MPDPTAEDRLIIKIDVSQPRRFFALATLVCLGGLVLWLGVIAEAGAVWQRAVFFGFGGLMLLLALRMWRVTSLGLLMTDEGIFDTNGTPLAPMEAIRSVERGVFAFKPSNGFLLRLDRPMPRVWRPGLWWRMGRRVGVGGVCNGSETRAMADILSIKLAQAGKGDR